MKTQNDMNEPADIVSASEIVKTLRNEGRIRRVYAPDDEKAGVLRNILGEIEQ